MKIQPTITRQMTAVAAMKAGYVPITYGYRPTLDGALMENALKQLRQGGIRHLLVNNLTTGHPEIWRHASEVKGIAA